MDSQHGINTPLFSLRSKNSSGIGEFLDLKLLIDWLSSLKLNIIQLLPLYASGQDPSPYNAISANALNPIYLSLHALPDIEQAQDLLQKINGLKAYNMTVRIQYAEVKKHKEEILRLYIERLKNTFLSHPDYIQFKKDNPWLEAFAAFKVLIKQEPDADYHKIVQYLAYTQLHSVKLYAEQKNMRLMGDIPILVSKDSADVWSHPHLFDLRFTAGAPPDVYSKEGQNWGFPLYNQQEMQNRDYSFWKERLQTAAKGYHLYRIDHIVGFFRIFAIPLGKPAKSGHFIPDNREEWLAQGKKMLKMMLAYSSMTPIGEDLGVIPKEVRATMHNLGICGTKVLYWERNWNTDRSFVPLSQYPKDSLTTVSTHDSEPLALWWQNHPEDAKTFSAFLKIPYEKTLSEENLFAILKASHHTTSLFHINLLQEYLGLIPELNWQNPEDERINVPGTVSPFNWTYRYKISIEEMIDHPKLSLFISELIA